MALNFKPLNREGNWTVAQKKSLKKLFELAESAATGSDSSIISDTVVHTTLSGYFDSEERHAVGRLMNGIRSAIDATDNAYDVKLHLSGHGGGNQKRVVKALADAVIVQIV
jgi:hypothetical protein